MPITWGYVVEQQFHQFEFAFILSVLLYFSGKVRVCKALALTLSSLKQNLFSEIILQWQKVFCKGILQKVLLQLNNFIGLRMYTHFSILIEQ